MAVEKGEEEPKKRDMTLSNVVKETYPANGSKRIA